MSKDQIILSVLLSIIGICTYILLTYPFIKNWQPTVKEPKYTVVYNKTFEGETIELKEYTMIVNCKFVNCKITAKPNCTFVGISFDGSIFKIEGNTTFSYSTFMSTTPEILR